MNCIRGEQTLTFFFPLLLFKVHVYAHNFSAACFAGLSGSLFATQCIIWEGYH